MLVRSLLYVHKCPTGDLTVLDENKNNGLCAILAFTCTQCKQKSSMLTSKEVNVGRRRAFDVNKIKELCMLCLNEEKREKHWLAFVQSWECSRQLVLIAG